MSSLHEVFTVSGCVLLVHAYQREGGTMVFTARPECGPQTADEAEQFRIAIREAELRVARAVMTTRSFWSIRIEPEGIFIDAEPSRFGIGDLIGFCRTEFGGKFRG